MNVSEMISALERLDGSAEMVYRDWYDNGLVPVTTIYLSDNGEVVAE